MELRLDHLLIARGLFASRSRAQAAIAAGRVSVGGRVVTRASEAVAADAEVMASDVHPFVSRGGVKLAFALEAFGVPVEGRIALDVGASTGGFSQVLLQAGAARVYAVDSGRGQLHPSLHGAARLVSLESRDARSLSRDDVPEPVDVIVVDVSFISLALVLPPVLALAAPAADLVALVKPQFEAGRAAVGKGGIVRDAAARQAACRRVAEHVAGLGWTMRGLEPSPIAGGDGNQEFLLAARGP